MTLMCQNVENGVRSLSWLKSHCMIQDGMSQVAPTVLHLPVHCSSTNVSRKRFHVTLQLIIKIQNR